jgi:hypothetical protein
MKKQKNFKVRNLTINLYYIDSDGCKWRFQELAEDKGFISSEHLNLNSFSQARGGIEVIHERIFKFIDIIDVEDLSFPVYFLIYSLINLTDVKGYKCQNLKIDYDDKNTLSKMILSNQDYIELKIANEDYLILNYHNSDSLTPDYRNSPYFHELLISKNEWIYEVIHALTDFFLVIQKIKELDSNSRNPFINLMDCWNYIKKP